MDLSTKAKSSPKKVYDLNLEMGLASIFWRTRSVLNNFIPQLQCHLGSCVSQLLIPNEKQWYIELNIFSDLISKQQTKFADLTSPSISVR